MEDIILQQLNEVKSRITKPCQHAGGQPDESNAN